MKNVDSIGPSVITEHEDPQHMLAGVEDKWRVVDKVELGSKHANGHVVTGISPTFFEAGDFVGVIVGIRINTSMRRGNRSNRENSRMARVIFTIREVIRLLPAKEVPQVSVKHEYSIIQN